MNQKIENVIDEIEKKQLQLIKNKENLMLKEQELEIETANINCKTKDEWKELEITNGEGRKAFTVKNLKELKNKVHKAKLKVQTIESELKVLNKKFEYFMLKYEIENKTTA